MDSLGTMQHDTYKPESQSIRLEGPIGAIEVDSGNNIIDGTVIVVIILALYVGKKIIDKYVRR